MSELNTGEMLNSATGGGQTAATEAEALERAENGTTRGRKGAKRPQVTILVKPSVESYIRTMARARGETMSEFIAKVVEKHMEEHIKVYNEIMRFRERSL